MFLKRNGWLNRFTCFMLGVNEFYFNNTDICYFTRGFFKACLLLIWRTFLVLLVLFAFFDLSFVIGKDLYGKFGFDDPTTWWGMILMGTVGLACLSLLVSAVVGVFFGWFYFKSKFEDWWNNRIEEETPSEDMATLTKLLHSWKHKYCAKVRLK